MITSSLLTLIALFTSPAVEAPFQDMTFDQALAAAKKDQKIVMIDFFTTWCLPCKKLDKITWKDADVQAWIAKTAVALKLDAEKEAELAKRFKVEAYPTIVFVRSDGQEIDRLLGFKEPADFVNEATSALRGKDAIARVKEKMAGNENSPMERQKLGQALAQKGKYEEALTEYLWCFDHGNEHEAGFAGVRLSFLLGHIADLGSKYPPATKALEERRDAAQKVLESGKGSFADAADVSSLNHYLHATDQTVALYDRLNKEQRLTQAMKNAFFLHVLDPLIDARRYRDVVEGAGDIESVVKQRIALYEMTAKLTKAREGNSKETQELGDDFMKQETIAFGGKYYEALLGAEQPKTAEAVADLMIGFDKSAQTFATLVEHAARAGANDAAQAFLIRGLGMVDEKGQERLKLAARKIGEQK